MFSSQTGSFPLYACLVAAAPLLAYAALILMRKRALRPDAVPAWQLALIVTACSLAGARLTYVLFRFEDFVYGYGLPAIVNLGVGSCLMYGGIFGALIGAALAAMGASASIPATLDELTVPGLTAIAVIRAAELFTSEGIGPLIENKTLCFFPLAVQNEYGEWNLAVFVLEAAVAAAMLIAFLRAKPQPAGERILTALLVFSCCQIPLENLRSDSCLQVGFVRVTQVFAALVILAVALLRAKPLGRRAMARHATFVLLCVVGIGIIEWAQDKTNIPNFLLYVVMAALCAAMAIRLSPTARYRRTA